MSDPSPAFCAFVDHLLSLPGARPLDDYPLSITPRMLMLAFAKWRRIQKDSPHKFLSETAGSQRSDSENSRADADFFIQLLHEVQL